MKSTPNQNFSITICQASILTQIPGLILSPQVQIDYSSVQVRTRSLSDFLPEFNEKFNFEMMKGEIVVTLLNNPKFFKESVIGCCSIPVRRVSGWFNLTKEGKKVGSIRVIVQEDSENQSLLIDYQKKLAEAKKIQEQVKELKKKYMNKAQAVKERSLTCRSKHLEDIENNDICKNSLSVKHEMKELISKKALIKMQEENLEIEKERIQIAWNEIENEKKEVQAAISKIKDGLQENQVAKCRNNILNRISEYTKNRAATPKSAKSHLFRNSEFSLTQPRLDD
jgi:hypothetical protein